MRKLSSLLALISALLLGVTLVMAETDAAPATHATARHATSAPGQRPARPFRILHIMSFDSPWRWTDGQFAGFKAGMGDAPVAYRVFQMDVKHNGSPEAKARKGREARALIESWRPDLVYTSDDDAQDHVTRHYAGTPLPFVFSGVNKRLSDHGIEAAANVTGVLEQEH